jgi:hypothetical protein
LLFRGLSLIYFVGVVAYKNGIDFFVCIAVAYSRVGWRSAKSRYYSSIIRGGRVVVFASGTIEYRAVVVAQIGNSEIFLKELVA